MDEENPSKLSVRVELEGPILSLFLEIKKERHFELNTEAIRYCITETAKEDSFSLVDEHTKHISSLLSNEIIRKKYSIYSIQDFIRRAIDNFVAEIQDGVESIQSFDVRSTLTDDENDLALGIIELQNSRHDKMVTIEDLAEYLQQRNVVRLKETLDNFVNQLILSRMVHKGETYYHAKE